ncbi:uncharacterized protein LAESUDRAFT_317328 [Laetiporus sulphureus 93-53]|uniref:Uncharacterized protein n=1 Tax=Laetiporus sulphureus 93-53 TaxID=1314785 RepID=A0A165D0J8_9APHY|nr:uncharacterized protein LAESUDRAFT_317328 [Laetiporus sulphureus 93-53]KZT03892.1 hypothetical protein LAESUDRAFT_317328 [Laetiporus sulphureus 93-53]
MCAPPPPGECTLLLLVHHQTERVTYKVMNNWLVAVIVSTVVAGAAIVVLTVALLHHRSQQISQPSSQDGALDHIMHDNLSGAELGLQHLSSWSLSQITLLTSESGKCPSHQEVVNLPNPSKQVEDASMHSTHDISYLAIGIPLKPNCLEDFSHGKLGWIHHELALKTRTRDTPSHGGAEGNSAKAAVRPPFISRFRPARREPDRGASVSRRSSDAQRLDSSESPAPINHD